MVCAVAIRIRKKVSVRSGVNTSKSYTAGGLAPGRANKWTSRSIVLESAGTNAFHPPGSCPSSLRPLGRVVLDHAAPAYENGCRCRPQTVDSRVQIM